jgi:hypothetical protein
MLMKFYPTTGLYVQTDKSIVDWLNAHGRCHPRSHESDLADDPGFTLHTEDSLDGKELRMDRQNYTPKHGDTL